MQPLQLGVPWGKGPSLDFFLSVLHLHEISLGLGCLLAVRQPAGMAQHGIQPRPWGDAPPLCQSSSGALSPAAPASPLVCYISPSWKLIYYFTLLSEAWEHLFLHLKQEKNKTSLCKTHMQAWLSQAHGAGLGRLGRAEQRDLNLNSS